MKLGKRLRVIIIATFIVMIPALVFFVMEESKIANRSTSLLAFLLPAKSAPSLVSAQNAPNIIVFLLDDVGFSGPTPFGGPIATPTMEKLAQDGLRYTMFNTETECAETRNVLLKDKHKGYISEILRNNGYATAAFGKWHLTADKATHAGWPTAQGFDYFYGFLGDTTDQYHPVLYENTTPIERPLNKKDYHLSSDLAEQAMSWIRRQQATDPHKPFFIYFATGAAHTPHQIFSSWSGMYAGKFNQGWDKLRVETLARQIKLGIIPRNLSLSARPEVVPAWSSLTPEEQRAHALRQEIYAGFLTHADVQIGRVVNSLARFGLLKNTLIIYIAGDSVLNDEGWAWSSTAPWTKQEEEALSLSTRKGMVIHWPNKIKTKGEIRPQSHQVADVAPTILEAAGIQTTELVNTLANENQEGVSMVYSFNDSHKSQSTLRQ